MRVAEHAGVLLDFQFPLVEEDIFGDRIALWALQRPRLIPPTTSTCDAALHQEGYIIVVPMHADEDDRALLSHRLQHPEELPSSPTSAPGE